MQGARLDKAEQGSFGTECMAGEGAWPLVMLQCTAFNQQGLKMRRAYERACTLALLHLLVSMQKDNLSISELHCLDSGDSREARPPQPPPPPSAPARMAAPALATLGPPGPGPADGCLIKGNIGAKGNHIYHMPGGRFYPGVKV